METIKINGLDLTLQDIEKDCWLRILNGSLKGKDAFHTPTIANVKDGIANIRTVVLRQVNTKAKTLSLHTDIRSGKLNAVQENNNLSWHFYDASSRFQIRLGGQASLHHNDALADEAWQKCSSNSRKTYLTQLAPSTKSEIPTSGLLPVHEQNNIPIETTEVGRQNFGIITCKANWMEWLWLNHAGHRRAAFEYMPNETFEASWLIP